jgi:hypothetical protein
MSPYSASADTALPEPSWLNGLRLTEMDSFAHDLILLCLGRIATNFE